MIFRSCGESWNITQISCDHVSFALSPRVPRSSRLPRFSIEPGCIIATVFGATPSSIRFGELQNVPHARRRKFIELHLRACVRRENDLFLFWNDGIRRHYTRYHFDAVSRASISSTFGSIRETVPCKSINSVVQNFLAINQRIDVNLASPPKGRLGAKTLVHLVSSEFETLIYHVEPLSMASNLPSSSTFIASTISSFSVLLFSILTILDGVFRNANLILMIF